jgi:hypothetical protein
MYTLAHKSCPRCHLAFECRADAIHLCQCSSITLSQEERSYISEQFDDCLCTRCMTDMKEEHINMQDAHNIKGHIRTDH